MSTLISVIALISATVTLGIVTGSVGWNAAQNGNINTVQDDKLVLGINTSALETRVMDIQSSCTDTALNDTVSSMIQRIVALQHQLDSAMNLLMITPPELVSKGKNVPVDGNCGLIPCQVVSMNEYLIMMEFQATDFAIWNTYPVMNPSFPPNAVVNVTQSGNYWFGLFLTDNERSGGGAIDIVMELVDGNDNVLDMFTFKEFHHINGFTYVHSYYAAKELTAGTFIKYRILDTGTVWVFSDTTFGFLIQV